MKMTLKALMDLFEKIDKNSFVGIKLDQAADDEQAIIDIDVTQSYHPGLAANVVLIVGAMVIPKDVKIEGVDTTNGTASEGSADAESHTDPSAGSNSEFLRSLSGRGSSEESAGGKGLGDFKPAGDNQGSGS